MNGWFSSHIQIKRNHHLSDLQYRAVDLDFQPQYIFQIRKFTVYRFRYVSVGYNIKNTYHLILQLCFDRSWSFSKYLVRTQLVRQTTNPYMKHPLKCKLGLSKQNASNVLQTLCSEEFVEVRRSLGG